jgi:hypothetical protein
MNDHIPDPTKMINDGGPAFALGPTASTMKPHADGGGHMIVTHYGMERGISIRDYFAAAALEKASRGSDRSADEIAKRAFYIADAMIRAREAK